MKKRLFILAAIIITAVTTITVVSCKKDDNVELKREINSLKSVYQPPKVDDMNAYLRDFKQKLQTKGNNETMDIEEAAWHLSSLANYDFGDVVNDYAKFRYDTLYYRINVENNKVNVSDMSSFYSRIADDIETYFQTLDLENKHIRFIGVDILDNGLVVMSIMVSYDWVDHQWYFPDPFTLDSVLSLYYSEDSIYYMAGNFRDELKRVLDILTGHVNTSPSLKYFYVHTRTDSLRYNDPNYTDPYLTDPYSMNPFNSRIFAVFGHSNTMSMDEMYYYTDSYAEIGESNAGIDEVVLSWYISPLRHDIIQGSGNNTYHVPAVRYGQLVEAEPITPPQD